MLIYNTTYQTGIDDARNFVIWLSESYIPEVEKTGILQNPRLTHILSHKEQDSECFSLQLGGGRYSDLTTAGILSKGCI